MNQADQDNNASQRLDKWLWAARFFKTRRLSVEAISGGKVQLNGQRVKPSRAVKAGMTLRIQRGELEYTVVVAAINAQRRPANEARLLYQETPESIAAREQQAAAHRSAGERERGSGRPTKRDRRQIHRFRDG